MLATIHERFSNEPVASEQFAIAIWRSIEPSVEEVTIAQASSDGGRDAIGRHALGPPADRVVVDFALEAECCAVDSGVQINSVSRLISRLLHRQYGVLVTTSYIGEHLYKAIRQAGHPVVVVAGIDVVNALCALGITTAPETEAWLLREFKLR